MKPLDHFVGVDEMVQQASRVIPGDFSELLACNCCDGSPMVIRYIQRYPIKRCRPDGTRGCRGCGGPIPKGRTAWCCRACCARFEPGEVVIAVNDRDKGICQICSLDIITAVKEWRARRAAWKFERPGRGAASYVRFPEPKPEIEYDHITPFSEGGLTIAENMRTLCRECHLRVTREWRREKKIMRRRSYEHEIESD